MQMQPNPGMIFPVRGCETVTYVKQTVKNPNIIVGDFAYFSDTSFEKYVLHHYDFIGDRLIIGKFCRIAPDVNNRINASWLAITATVMLALPFGMARFTPADAGMALCMILFYIVNPIYSAILGYRCGRNVRQMWSLPLVSSMAFLTGAWLFFEIREVWFAIYATTYLALGWSAMRISLCLKKYLGTDKHGSHAARKKPQRPLLPQHSKKTSNKGRIR